MIFSASFVDKINTILTVSIINENLEVENFVYNMC